MPNLFHPKPILLGRLRLFPDTCSSLCVKKKTLGVSLRAFVYPVPACVPQPKDGDQRTTVFKKTDLIYQLKMKSSRAFFSEMNKNFANMPFSLRGFKDEKTARLGVTECVKHEVVDAFKILWENKGAHGAVVRVCDACCKPSVAVRRWQGS